MHYSIDLQDICCLKSGDFCSLGVMDDPLEGRMISDYIAPQAIRDSILQEVDNDTFNWDEEMEGAIFLKPYVFFSF